MKKPNLDDLYEAYQQARRDAAAAQLKHIKAERAERLAAKQSIAASSTEHAAYKLWSKAHDEAHTGVINAQAEG